MEQATQGTAFVKVQDVKKVYGAGGALTQALRGATLEVPQGEVCVILGASGSGKSTLLNIIGGLEPADAGGVSVGEWDLTDKGQRELVEYRRSMLGFVFQSYNLIGNLTVRENVAVCRYLSADPLDEGALLDACGLAQLERRYPPQLSGGQQQRVSIARALIKNPPLLLCDEPTGALDSTTAKDVLALIERVNRRWGTTVLMVTHNEDIARMAHLAARVRDGLVVSCARNGRPVTAARLW
jgi:putative ABC transport system ATP-binding protein